MVFFQNVQMALDVATALSILVAAIAYALNSHTDRRKKKRQVCH